MERVFCVVILVQFFCFTGNVGVQFSNFLGEKEDNIICENFEKNKDSCFAKIKHQNFTGNESNIRAELYCVQIYSATIIWTVFKGIEKNYTFAIQIFSSADQSIAVNTVNDTRYFFSELQANTKYQVLISRIDPSGSVFLKDVTTLEFITKSENFKPLAPSWFNVTELIPINQTFINIIVEWNFTNEGAPCYYEIWCLQKIDYGPLQRFFRHPIVNQYEKKDFKYYENQYEIKDLKYYESYEIWMLTYLERNGERIENKTIIQYNTPSCLKVLNNLSICPAPQVEKIEVDMDCNQQLNCLVNISWSVKDFQPDYYLVIIDIVHKNRNLSLYTNFNTTEKHVSISLLNNTYKVSILTVINETTSLPTSKKFLVKEANKIPETRSHLVAIISILFVLLLIISSIKCRNNDEPSLPKLYNEVKILNKEPNKKNELPKYQLILGKKLGKGNFGIVFRGTLMKNSKKYMDVAVKTLQSSATTKEIQQFEKEISLMEDVGLHNNIVGMIGSCYNAKRPLLIVEYCSLGDLHTYLCNVKKTLANISHFNLPTENQYQNLVTQSGQQNSRYLVHNKIYGVTTKDVIVPELSICDLLSFGRQVAIGMEYLASNYVVHRDLAARNVLLCNDKTVKISDFGLSRDIYVENIYRKLEGSEPMPIKWMAPESIRNQEYTTLSDVWSFGIFLWELFTLGDEPYSDISCPHVLYLRLKDGYRMWNPCTSYPELYEIMLNCWQEMPELRLQFSVLHELLDQMLKRNAPNQYITITSND